MISVIVDKKLLNLKKKETTGLISGLKRLNDFVIEIVIENYVKKDFQNLDLIFRSESIAIKSNPSFERKVFITTDNKKTNFEKVIKINNNGKIKTFADAVNEVLKLLRSAKVKRKTKETDIGIDLSLDGVGKSKIKTGIGFFDHMLEQIAKHGNILLNINVKGDLEIDEHHTVEDTGIALGEALLNALGTKNGIKRYGFFLPMDESIAKCSVDLGGRSYLNFKCDFTREFVGELPTELVVEFFRGLAGGLKANIYIEANGKNDHHKIENIFKAFAKALNEACRFDERTFGSLPSTKGVL